MLPVAAAALPTSGPLWHPAPRSAVAFMPSSAMFITGILSAFLAPAHATEVVWDGHYRARGEIFDSLSLSDTNPNAEGAAWHMDHRFRVRPGFRITDRVAVFTQVDLLPYVQWGTQPVAVADPFTGENQPVVYSDAVGPPTTDSGAVTPQNLQVTRLWGEVQTDYGLFRFGRVPNHWGSGMVFNAGNRPIDEFGDTVDRLQFTGKAGPVYLMGGLENRYEGLAAERDDYRAVVGSILYQNEKAGLGFLSTYRWKGEAENRTGCSSPTSGPKPPSGWPKPKPSLRQWRSGRPRWRTQRHQPALVRRSHPCEHRPRQHPGRRACRLRDR